jgi:hypothetical protein
VSERDSYLALALHLLLIKRLFKRLLWKVVNAFILMGLAAAREQSKENYEIGMDNPQRHASTWLFRTLTCMCNILIREVHTSTFKETHRALFQAI